MGGRKTPAPQPHPPAREPAPPLRRTIRGGGAVLLAAQPGRAVIADTNPDLISLWQAIKTQPEKLLDLTLSHQANHNPDHYQQVRAMDRQPEWGQADTLTRAARLLYLNKSCYNGLWRVNKHGHMNTPIGSRQTPVNPDQIRHIHQYLTQADVQILCQDWQDTLTQLTEPAFIYLDPPYVPASPTASFTAYTPGGFTMADQQRLHDTCATLTKDGHQVLVSNSDTPVTRAMWADFTIETVHARRTISSTRRGGVTELLIHGQGR